MRHKKLGIGLALLVLLLSAVLGATVLREPLAYAATQTQSVLVANTAANPVPVKQQGSVALAGTADVNVTNTSLPIAQAPVTNGGSTAEVFVGEQPLPVTPDATASALMVRFTDGGADIQMVFRYKGNTVLIVPGAPPAGGINGPPVVINVPLTRPVKFDEVECVDNGPFGKRLCAAYWAGATP